MDREVVDGEKERKKENIGVLCEKSWLTIGRLWTESQKERMKERKKYWCVAVRGQGWGWGLID